jgi:formylglycine-generating enzyme required for sulfatase activity
MKQLAIASILLLAMQPRAVAYDFSGKYPSSHAFLTDLRHFWQNDIVGRDKRRFEKFAKSDGITMGELASRGQNLGDSLIGKAWNLGAKCMRIENEQMTIHELYCDELETFLKEHNYLGDATKRAARTIAAVKPIHASTGQTGIKWVRIPGGTLSMGSSEDMDSQPIHSVTIKSFQMAKTLVTNKQYKVCVEAGACSAPDAACLTSEFSGEDQPVVCVDWNQANAFAHWAGARLPSESEWEYAARSGGKERKFPWGDAEASCELAVLDGTEGCGRNATWPVCSKPQGNTQQGLCDMAGNAWEWTQDWGHDSYDGSPNDGSAWESPAGSIRIYRGGSWECGGGTLASANRGGDTPDSFNPGVGFRIAKSL